MIEAALLAAAVVAGSMQARHRRPRPSAVLQAARRGLGGAAPRGPAARHVHGGPPLRRPPAFGGARGPGAAGRAPAAPCSRACRRSTARGLDGQDRISYDMFARELRDDVADHEFGPWRLPINADSGFHTDFAGLPRARAAGDDARLRELHRAPARVPGLRRASRSPTCARGCAPGFTLPRVVLRGLRRHHPRPRRGRSREERVLRALRAFPAGVPEGERARLAAAGRAAVVEGAVAGYRDVPRLHDRRVHARSTRTTIGASELPRGREYYAHLVRHFTTLDVTPEEVHQIGLARGGAHPRRDGGR